MTQIVFDFPPSAFAALRRSPDEFAAEMRIAAAAHWYSQGMLSQERAAELAGLDRVAFLEELFHRKISACQVEPADLQAELDGA